MGTNAPKVLVMDGNRENLQALIADFSKALPAARVFTASDAVAALDLAAREDPDVLILDITTAGVDEYAICRKIRESEKLQNLPLVFLTDSHTEQEELAAACDAGADGFLARPLSKGELTVQVRSMTRMKRSSGYFSLILDSVPALIWQKDREGRYLQVNHEYCRTVGMDRSSILGRTDHDLFPKEIADKYVSDDRKVFGTGEAQRGIEEHHLKPSGEYGWSCTHKIPYFDDHGHVEGVVGFALDITGQKRTLDELRRMNSFLDSVFENIPNMVFIKDAKDLKFLRFNRAGEEFLGYCRSELLGKNDSDFFPKEQADFFMGNDRRVLNGKKSMDIPQELLRTRHKGTRVLHTRKVPILNESGEPEYLLGISEDITERKHAEEALRKSEERFRVLSNDLPAMVCEFLPDSTLTFVNRAYCEFFGMTSEQLTGRPFLDLLPEEAREGAKDHYLSLTPQEPTKIYSHEIFREGQTRWQEWRDRAIFDEAGRAVKFQSIGIDITERKQAEEILQVERDLALDLGSAGSFEAALKVLLRAVLRIDDLDSGGIYVVEKEKGALQLVCHEGISRHFVEQSLWFAPHTPQARFARKGIPGYWSIPDKRLTNSDLLQKEGIRSLGAIPVRWGEEMVAMLYIGTRVHGNIPQDVRKAVEIIAAHVGGVVSRVRLQEELNFQRERLLEANAALKVILRQREEDRAEMEENLLENIRQFIFPYAEKLKQQRLSADQRLYIELMESHLMKIADPFIRKISSAFMGLTPTEIRVAELIRQGKTSKEIAEILGSSERAVVFHRQSIRGKFGLKETKTNLQSYIRTRFS